MITLCGLQRPAGGVGCNCTVTVWRPKLDFVPIGLGDENEEGSGGNSPGLPNEHKTARLSSCTSCRSRNFL
jgi:hypothetical protein